ncbi:LuxR C-terminal-related transcriptional regulator [Sungkyunkwania multivorans]|uniref:LuxR C-terminal-related transcriptional regulator n=1 Tax=Sungkyunkwania multivorans TaxID=1173618 RepID=A0ABW3CTH7_9FLAO
MRKTAVSFLMLATFTSWAQYSFRGHVGGGSEVTVVYLSIVEDYRKLSRISLDQIIRMAEVDSMGMFQFSGDNLPSHNGIYRIHVDSCNDQENSMNHFLGYCNERKSISFIANNKDTIYFPSSRDGELLCDIKSNDPRASMLLEIDQLKEEMFFDISEYPSAANRKLSMQSWFKKLQQYGTKLNEPLAELYIFDFLSDKRNETYEYYLEDLSKNTYYYQLLNRLNNTYPETKYAELYEAELSSDQHLISLRDTAGFPWKYLIYSILLVSLGFNVFFLAKYRRERNKIASKKLNGLTNQEQKILDLILQNKTNKEIASEIFVSLSTVKTHINHLYKKLNVQSREEIKSLNSK